MAPLHIRISSNGYTALYGDELESLVKAHLPDWSTTASHPLHITLLTKDEARSLDSNPFTDAASPKDLIVVGLGGDRAQGALHLVVLANSLQVVRKKAGLPLKDFHITLSTPPRSSPEDWPHGLATLFADPLAEPHPPVKLLDALSLDYFLRSDFSTAYEMALRCTSSLHPPTAQSHIRLGDAALKLEQHKLAMLAYARAWELAEDDKLRQYALKGIGKCSLYTEWGTSFEERERGDLEGLPTAKGKGQVTDGDHQALWTPWSTELRSEVAQMAEEMEKPELCLESREKVFLLDEAREEVRLMRFFRWILPFRLAVSSIPRHQSDIAALASPALAIRHVVTLSLEDPLPSAWFDLHPSIRNTFIPVKDFGAPSLEQVEIFLRLAIEACETGEALLVHCAGGKGRAGTFIACWLVAFGFAGPSEDWQYPAMSASEAIAHLRRIRPGSIESHDQEELVRHWSKHISKRRSPLPPPVEEPPPSSLEISGSLPPSASPPDLVVLCGLPGSGKSTFRNALITRNAQGWTTASGDEDGGTGAVQRAALNFRSGKKSLLLDQVNATVDKRRALLSLAHNALHPTIVWFDIPLETCLPRAQQRTNHALPPGGRVRAAIKQFNEQWEAPTLEEGWKAIVRITSREAAAELVQRWTPASATGLLKFPRTPHLVNLGAATEDDEVSSRPMRCAEGEQMVVTEKADGANLGFSLDEDGRIVVQNRSHFVDEGTHVQFKRLGIWVEEHRDELFVLLGRDASWRGRYILYGEWMAAVHSVKYTRLPDHFLAFDLLDRATSTFASRPILTALLRATTIHLTPQLYSGPALPTSELVAVIQGTSAFGEGRMEGVYVKVESDGKVRGRGKIVRPDFIAGNQHWTKGQIEFNDVVR